IRHFKSSVGDLLDVVGRPYDSINHVVVHGVTKSDHAVAALREVAQTPENVAADLNLHSGLAKIDIAAILQFKAHHILHNPREARSYRNRKVSRPDAIREVAEDGQCWAKGCRTIGGARLMHSKLDSERFESISQDFSPRSVPNRHLKGALRPKRFFRTSVPTAMLALVDDAALGRLVIARRRNPLPPRVRAGCTSIRREGEILPRTAAARRRRSRRASGRSNAVEAED